MLHTVLKTVLQILACIEQAVQRTPDYPESHNLHGLVCEARHNYHTAIASYRLALAAMSVCPDNSVKSHAVKISINLVRSLSKVRFPILLSVVNMFLNGYSFKSMCVCRQDDSKNLSRNAQI